MTRFLIIGALLLVAGGVFLLLEVRSSPSSAPSVVPADRPREGGAVAVEDRPTHSEPTPAAKTGGGESASPTVSPASPTPSATATQPAQTEPDPASDPPPSVNPDTDTRKKMDEANSLVAEENPTREQMEKALQIADESLVRYKNWNPALFVAVKALCELGDRERAKDYIGRMDAPGAVEDLRASCKKRGIEL